MTSRPSRGGKSNGVLLNRAGHVDRFDHADHFHDLAGVGHGLEIVQWVGLGMDVDHRYLGAGYRVTHRDPGHEPVALSLGKGVRALHLDRVLGRYHHER